MEAVAAHALVVEALAGWRSGRRARRGRGGRRCRSRRPAAARADSRSIERIGARLCGWCSGASGIIARRGCASTLVVDQHRPVVVRAAVHDAMADRDGSMSPRRRAASRRPRRARPARRARSSGARFGRPEPLPSAPLGAQARPRADAVDLALRAARSSRAAVDAEDLELEARGAGVDDEDRVHRRSRRRHGASARRRASA